MAEGRDALERIKSIAVRAKFGHSEMTQALMDIEREASAALSAEPEEWEPKWGKGWLGAAPVERCEGTGFIRNPRYELAAKGSEVGMKPCPGCPDCRPGGGE